MSKEKSLNVANIQQLKFRIIIYYLNIFCFVLLCFIIFCQFRFDLVCLCLSLSFSQYQNYKNMLTTKLPYILQHNYCPPHHCLDQMCWIWNHCDMWVHLLHHRNLNEHLRCSKSKTNEKGLFSTYMWWVSFNYLSFSALLK